MKAVINNSINSLKETASFLNKRSLLVIASAALSVSLSLTVQTTSVLALPTKDKNERTKTHTKKPLNRRVKNNRIVHRTFGCPSAIVWEISPLLPTNPAVVPNPLPTDVESPPKPKIKD